MGDRDDGARETVQKLLQPVDAFRIQMVGRFVEQQHVGFGQQQTAQRNTALLAARQLVDFGVPRRQAQCVGGDLELMLGIGTGIGQQCFVLGLFGCKLVEIRIRFGISGINLIELFLRVEHFTESLFHRFAHGLLGIQLRLLLQETDVQIRHRRRFAVVFLVDTGHDLEQAGFSRAVDAEHADLGAGEKRQRDVFENLAFGGHHLAHPVHREYVLSHGAEFRKKK